MQSIQFSVKQTTLSAQTGGGSTKYVWSVNGIKGGNSALGTITPQGLYTAPATPPDPATTTITVTSTSSQNGQANATVVPVSISVSPTTASVQLAQTQQFSATVLNTSNTAVSWSVNGVSGGNSTVGTISTAGLYTAPAALPSPSTVTITATSAADTTKQSSASLTVTGSQLTITTSSLPNGQTGSAYSASLTATGGTAPYTWSIASGLLPTGVGVGSLTGTVSGTPSTAGTYNVTVQVTDSAGGTATKAFSFAIVAALTVSTATLPNAAVGIAYDVTLVASGGTAPLNWAVSSGQLPPGLSLSSSGSITGTSTTAGNYSFTAQVTDSGAPQQTANEQLTLGVTSGSTQVSDNFDRTALGPNWTMAFGSIIVLNNQYTSDQSNYPQDSAAFWNASSFTPNHYAQATLNLPDNTSYSGVLVRGSVNNGYFCYAANQFLFLQKRVAGVETVLANTNSYAFQAGDVMRLDVYGSTIRCLINGSVKLTAADSDLSSGSPGISGSYATHTATGDNWSADDWSGLPLSLTTTLLPMATVNAAYSAPPLTASGGMTPMTWSVSAGQLPAGLSLDASTGVISGLPTVLGKFSFTIQAADASSPQKTASGQFTIAVTQNDIYGGSTALTGTNTGNWHTQSINGQWWIIDPLGNALHFVAPYNIGRGDGTTWNGSTMAARINTKYGATENNWPCAYLPAVVSRLQTWQFTGIGGGSDDNLTPIQQNTCWGMNSTLGGYYMPQQYRMPFVFYYQTSGYAMQNVALTYPSPAVSPLDQPVKNFNYGLNCTIGCRAPGGGEADYGDTRLYTYFDYLVPNANSYSSAPPAVQSYAMGAFIDEADQIYSFLTGGRNPAFFTGYEHQHGGLRALRISPLQYANRTKAALYPDGAVYVKSATLRNYLKGVYGTIAALNAAWSSNYSACDMEQAGDEFGSCGTKVTNETFATADGVTSAYTHKLAQSVPSMHSLAVYVGGALVAGDIGYNATDSDIYTAPGIPPAGPSKFYGPLVDISSSTTDFVNYTSATGAAGAVGIAFKAGSAALASVSGDGTTVTVKTQTQHGSWPGAHVSITGTANYNVSGIIAGVTDSYTFTIAAKNTGATEMDAGTAAFPDTAPPKGAAITISYVVNGWGIGNGLMDEDGRHSNCLGANNDPTNGVDLYLCTGGQYASAQIPNDLDGVLGQMANTYFSNMNTVFGNHYGNGTSRKLLNLGPDALIGSASPPAPGVLQAAGQYTDIIEISSYISGYAMTQAKLDYIRQYAGDKPLLNTDFIVGNPDSALRSFTANPAWPTFSTQPGRGTGYQGYIQLLTSFAYTNGGNKPYVGTQFWQWTDSIVEQANYGLVSPYDNAYDGNEASSGVVPCSPPLQSLSCGGEQYTSGNFILTLTAVNGLWLPH